MQETRWRGNPTHYKIVSGLDLERIEDIAKIFNEAIKDRGKVNLTVNNRGGGTHSLIVQKIADRLHSEKQQELF